MNEGQGFNTGQKEHVHIKADLAMTLHEGHAL